jgi:hypothetical protein
MAIQKQFVLRYREPGHVRFQIPVQFTDSRIAQALTDQLSAVDGIYRVKVYRRQGKLSIRYQEAACDFTRLARLLFGIVGGLEQKAMSESQRAVSARAKPDLKNRFKQLRISRWFGQKYGDAKETLLAAKILTKAGFRQQGQFFGDPEKVFIDFFNDVLVLFLIRLHWDHITKEWIPRPFKYRYEWMAVFYMIFLLMRSRRPK